MGATARRLYVLAKGVCWLLGTSVLKNQRCVPQKSGTGKPLINAYTGETGQKDAIFSLSSERNRGGNTLTSTPFDRASYYVKSLSHTLGT
jgi:hypothetical protein